MLLCLLLCTLVSATLAAREFNDLRAGPTKTALFALEEPEPTMDFGLSWQIELRTMEQPRGLFIGLGMEGLLRIDERLWLMPGASYLFGASIDAHRRPGSPEDFDGTRNASGIYGAELRLHGRADFLRWEQGALYVAGGPSVGYFYGSTTRSNQAQGTWCVGPTWLFGVELGQRVRAAFDTGFTLYFALNHSDAGWLEVGKPNGPVGVHVTLVRFSLRWYA
jgi:hypothetical protein